MNYQKIYDSIIQKAKSENRVKIKKYQECYAYYEKHHIKPRCLNGSNDENNLVLLTPREHYICHKLLVFIYFDNKKLIWALHRMTFSKRYGEILSSRDYEYARNALIKILSIKPGHTPRNKGKHNVQIYTDERNKKVAEKTKEAIHKKEIWEKFLKNNKKDKSAREKIREKRKMQIMKTGWSHSSETKEKIRKAHLGKKISEKTRAKFKKQYKCIYCEAKMNKSNLTRYHNENCKHKVSTVDRNVKDS